MFPCESAARAGSPDDCVAGSDEKLIRLLCQVAPPSRVHP
jgi:hypothetical protein